MESIHMKMRLRGERRVKTEFILKIMQPAIEEGGE